MTLAGQKFWREREARILLPLNVCPCCERPLPVAGAVDEVAIDVACATYGVTRDALMGHSKTRRISNARALVVWALRSLGDQISYDSIGMVLAGRHHSSMVNLHQKAIAMRLSDSTFAAACHAIAAQLQKGVHDHGSH